MPELQPFVVDGKMLSAGIQPHDFVVKNTGYWMDCVNARPSVLGVVPKREVIAPFTSVELTAAGVVTGWPYPQFFVGKGNTLLADASGIWLVNWGASWWSIGTKVVTGTAAPTEQKRWHFVDLGNAWLATNNKWVAVYPSRQMIPGSGWTAQYLKAQDEISTACEFGGRLILGGFNNVDMGMWGTFGPNVVWWSNVGGGNAFWRWLENAGVEITSDEQEEVFERNDSGYLFLPQVGTVHRILPLRSGIMVYGSDSIVYLEPIAAPITTFSQRVVKEFGIPGRDFVDGDRLGHVFVSFDKTLWRVNANLEFEKVGFKWIHGAMAIEYYMQTAVTFDEHDREAYVYNGNLPEGFVLGEVGMGRIAGSPSSFTNSGSKYTDDPVAMKFSSAPANNMAVTLGPFDFDTAEVKRLSMVEVVSLVPASTTQLTSVITARVNYRHKQSESYLQTGWFTCDKVGRFSPDVSGTEFVLEIISDNLDVAIGSVKFFVMVGGKARVKEYAA